MYKLKECIGEEVEKKNVNFGNARFVRNLFEKTLENLASRVSRYESVSKEDLQKITAADILGPKMEKV